MFNRLPGTKQTETVPDWFKLLRTTQSPAYDSQDVHASMSQVPLRRKLVVVGDEACGKTALLFAFAFKQIPSYNRAIFPSFIDDITIDNKPAEYELWDTEDRSDEDNRLRPLSYPRSTVIIIAFAISDLVSLHHVYSKWIHEVRKYCGSKIPIMLVGCKADLRPDWEHPDTPSNPCPWVTRQQGECMAHLIGAHAYMECSALKMQDVNDVYQATVRAGMLMKKGVGYPKS